WVWTSTIIRGIVGTRGGRHTGQYMTMPDTEPTPSIDRDAAAEAAVAALASIAIADARDPAAIDEAAAALAEGALAADLDAAEDGTELDDDSEVDGAPDDEALPSLIEALLFVSDGPVEPRVLGRTLGVPTRRVNRA